MKLFEAINSFTAYKYLTVKANTIYGYDGYLRHFSIFLRNPEIEDITLDDVVEYLRWTEDAGYKANTREKYALAIQELVRFFEKQGVPVIKSELIPVPRKEYNLPRVSKEEDFIKLIQSIPTNSGAYYDIRNLAVLWLLHDSGCRLGEIASINMSNLDLKERSVIIKSEKQRDGMPYRKIFWYNKITSQVMERWVEKREELLQKTAIEDKEALFLSVNGGVCADGRSGRRVDIGALGEMIRKQSRRAGLNYTLNAHSQRHALGRKLAERGANNSIISGVLGHKSLDSSRVYTILHGKELQNVFIRIMGKKSA
jgi:site-specific recombinase XerD